VSEVVTELFDEAGSRKFRLLRELGSGGFGSVWLASVQNPSGLEQRVAVKLLHATTSDPQAVDRLRDEAMVLANLHHPVILVAHDLVLLKGQAQLGPRVALVTEYVEGRDLGWCIHGEPDRIPISASLDVVGQVASALDAAWSSLGIVHRDVKPANIRVGRHGNVKLLDFGIARSDLLARSAQTSTRGVIGSLMFLAPERFDTERGPHPGSDMFSLGCVLYEAATREALFHGLDEPKVLGLHFARAKFEPFIEQRLRVPMPEVVRELLAQTLRYEPEARADAAAVCQRCERAIATLGEVSPLRQWCRQRAWAEPRSEPRSEPPSGPPGQPTPRQAEPRPAPPTPQAATSPSAETAPTLVRVVGWALASGTLVTLGLLGLGTAALSLLGLLGWRWMRLPAEEPLETLAPIERPAAGPRPAPPSPPPAAIEPPASEPPGTEPLATEPTATEPSAPQLPLVLVVGPPGSFFFDGARLGPTNSRYRLAPGEHRCGLGAQAITHEQDCRIEADSRTVTLEPPPEGPPMGKVSAAVPLELRSASGQAFGPGELPAGTYDIYADFGKGLVLAGQVVVGAGQQLEITCNKLRERCLP
jgi:serine/threonine protein kinase